MRELIIATNLKKTFTLSRKQQMLEKQKEKVRTAANGLSFSAYSGEIFGLLGPNGAGKTTTLRMLATLIRPDEGDAYIDGYSIVKEPEKVREKIGFLTSELKLEEFFTPNYLFDFFSNLHGIDPEVARARKAEMFEMFGIDKFAEVKVADLSTGMKQKASLCISLVHDPDVIISLKEKGKTIIVSTHIFSLIEKICDRVGIIINGEMCVCDTLENICKDKSLEDRFFEIYAEHEGGEGA